MECQLDPAAEAGPVDRGHGGIRERADPAEELMARAAALNRELAGRAGELRDVGARGEDERLSRDDERRPAAVFELRQQLL